MYRKIEVGRSFFTIDGCGIYSDTVTSICQNDFGKQYKFRSLSKYQKNIMPE